MVVLGACKPSTGGNATSTGGGLGVAHDFNESGTVRLIFANGFAKGEGALGSFEPLVFPL